MLNNRNSASNRQYSETEQKAALRNRTAGLAIALLLFVALLYIATYAKLG